MSKNHFLGPIMLLKVIFDTNFLMLLSKNREFLLEQLNQAFGKKTEKIVLKPIYEELKQIFYNGNFKTRRQAKTALQLIDEGKFRLVNIDRKPAETVDELIVRVAMNEKYFVATNDKVLKKKLSKLGVRIVYIRQRNRIEVKGKLF